LKKKEFEYKIESQDSDYLFENLIEYVNPPQETKILPVFKTNDFALYNNDSLEVMSRFPENYVDMIFADPPYMLSNVVYCYAGKMVSVNKGHWDKK